MKTRVILASCAVWGAIAGAAGASAAPVDSSAHSLAARQGGEQGPQNPGEGAATAATTEAATTGAATTGAATKPVTLEDLRGEARKEFAAELKDVPVGPTLKWEDVFRLERREKLLALTSPLGAMDEEKRLVIDGDPALSGKYFVNRDGPEAATVEPRRFTLLAESFGEGPADVIMKRAEIFTLPAMGNFDFVYTLATMRETVYVQVLQRPSDETDEFPVRMLVQVTDRDTEERISDIKVSGETFWDLRKRHPEEAARFLRPALEMLGHVQPLFGTDAKTAWQVLGAEASASNTELAKRIQTVLGRLESEKFADREAAQKELRSMGQAAAMLLRSWDRSKLSAQQNAEVDSFLADYMALDNKEVDRFAKSPDFLLDVMSLDEPTLRDIAWNRLKSVRPGAAGFVVSAPTEERAKQIARLRYEIYRDGASDPAATRPTGN